MSATSHPQPGEEKRWLDEPGNVTKLFRALAVVCVLLVAADLLYEKHGHYDFESWPGFHAVYGFAAYCFIVFTAKVWRRVVRRPEDYYGDDR